MNKTEEKEKICEIMQFITGDRPHMTTIRLATVGGPLEMTTRYSHDSDRLYEALLEIVRRANGEP